MSSVSIPINLSELEEKQGFLTEAQIFDHNCGVVDRVRRELSDAPAEFAVASNKDDFLSPETIKEKYPALPEQRASFYSSYPDYYQCFIEGWNLARKK